MIRVYIKTIKKQVLAGEVMIMDSLNKYQSDARRTLNLETSDQYKYANLGMGLAGEAGEVCDYLKKVVFHGHDLDKDKLCDELGDVLWYLANLADALGVPLADVANNNIAKLKKRYPEGFDSNRSIHRVD